jgi:ArsR family metal-binding transcriptional regulator
MSVPQEMMIQAEAIGAGMDQAQQQGMQIITPQGKYSSRALNALVGEINNIMPMMGEMTPMSEYSEDLTQLPSELINVLMAIMTIAEQAGIPIDMEINEIVSDQELAKLAALISRVAKDSKLKDFLKKDETTEVETQVQAESTPMSEGDMKISDEELFAQRV